MDSEIIKKLVNKAGSKKTAEYTYIVIFFLIFSFFIFFAIRPSLITALSLTKEEEELNKKNEAFEQDIINILSIQNTLQSYQDRLYLISDSLPSKPYLSKLLTDIEQNSEKNSIHITKIDFNEIILSKKKGDNLNKIEVNVQATSSFKNFRNFMSDLSNQRRIKSIEKIDILKDNSISSASSNLTITMKIVGYYL